MIYGSIQGEKVSRLGFGAMRLPVLMGEDGKPTGTIDEAQVQKMVDYAIANGVNYFDTAFPYHDGHSEEVLARCLSKYPRDSYFLADKYPGHQIAKRYDPADIFETQLKKCNAEYFDFYLLHNVYENSINVYLDPQWDIINYFLKQKELGRIKHLGFSTHGQIETIERFLDAADGRMEFCQIQINYLDWTLQDAKEKYEMLTSRGIPVIAMESVRGGMLAKLPEDLSAKLKALALDETAGNAGGGQEAGNAKGGAPSDASWGYRWLQQLPNISVILSGMSNFDQMVDNVNTFKEDKVITAEQDAVLMDIAEHLKGSVPCTACRYCCDSCPMGLDIPVLIKKYNDYSVVPSFNVSMYIDSLPEDKKPSACVGCGNCMRMCPQKIHIPEVLKKFSVELTKYPSWAEICRAREAAAEANRKAAKP
ncbi:MAG: aldo/keto reductase [Eubacteriales bacterium]|nr:aldo/keto reductase [Eubacteriales bacterium]